MKLEQMTASLNSDFFLPEFTFSNATFSPAQRSELELADGLIWLEDSAIIFQLKERTATDSTKEEDDRWFEKKVRNRATKQVRETLDYLDTYDAITAKNERGQEVVLRKSALRRLAKVVVYASSYARPVKCHQSRTAGMIHFFTLDDYRGVVSTLATLAELFDYLTWREMLLNKRSPASPLPEQSLLGHYLWGDKDAPLELACMRFVYALEQNTDEWDFSGILHKFHSRTYDGPVTDNSYHKIIGEVAKLTRGGLKTFKQRFALSMEKAREDQFVLPYRFSIPGTNCGFVFVPLQQEAREHRRTALHNFTVAHKYVEKLDRCVGLVFVADQDGFFTIDWTFIDWPWTCDPEMETLLSERFPFRQTAQKRLDLYSFSREIVSSFD